jgi:hypothetical protein
MGVMVAALVLVLIIQCWYHVLVLSIQSVRGAEVSVVGLDVEP